MKKNQRLIRALDDLRIKSTNCDCSTWSVYWYSLSAYWSAHCSVESASWLAYYSVYYSAKLGRQKVLEIIKDKLK